MNTFNYSAYLMENFSVQFYHLTQLILFLLILLSPCISSDRNSTQSLHLHLHHIFLVCFGLRMVVLCLSKELNHLILNFYFYFHDHLDPFHQLTDFFHPHYLHFNNYHKLADLIHLILQHYLYIYFSYVQDLFPPIYLLHNFLILTLTHQCKRHFGHHHLLDKSNAFFILRFKLMQL